MKKITRPLMKSLLLTKNKTMNDILKSFGLDNYLIVGSHALIHAFPHLERECKDLDVICNRVDFEKIKNCFSGYKEGAHDSLIVKYEGMPIEFLFADNLISFQEYLKLERNCYASKEILFSLKKGHIHHPISFKKHIRDYVLLGESLNWKDKLSKITKIHKKETEKRLGKNKTPKLNQTLDKFFGQSEKKVPYIFVHDEVHAIMAHKDLPMFEYMRDDKEMAKCSKEKWNAFWFVEKAFAVLEEAYVIALERKVLPCFFKGMDYWDSKDAFEWALMRICTNLTSGWFREFATRNYFKIQELYNEKYVEKFFKAFDSGRIAIKYP